MNTLIEEFIRNLNTGDVWIGFLALAIFYVLKKEPFKILSHFNELKIKDIEQAKSLLESEKLTKESNELIREYIENYTFKKYYGINANREMRSSLLKFYQKHQQKIGWHDIKRAYLYIKQDGTKIEISMSWTNHFGRWLITGLSWFVGFYSVMIIILAFLSRNDNSTQFILLTFWSVMLLGAAMLFSSINWPYHSAIKISKLTKE